MSIFLGNNEISLPNVDSVFLGNNQVYSSIEPLCFTALTGGSTVGILSPSQPPRTLSLKYSTDGATWNTYIAGTSPITLSNIGDKVYFRGNNPNGINSSDLSNYYRFTMTGRISASGNIMSLLGTNTIPNDYCFHSLFRGCAVMTTAPSLPATSLTKYCYCQLFRGCNSMTVAPELPATVMAEGCYSFMFYSCSSLTEAISLPATQLASKCYNYMFYQCTNITKIPALPATELFYDCYSSMFENCYALTVSETSGSGYTQQWNIPSNGVASGNYTMTNMFAYCAGTRSTEYINFNGVTKTYYTQNPPIGDYLCFTANTAGSTVAMSVTGAPTLGQNFQYTIDRINWNAFIPGATVVTLANIGDKVWFKGDNPNGVSEVVATFKFVMTGRIAGSGNIMSLIDDGKCTTTTIPNGLCFFGMFLNCASLTTAPNLPATSLTDRCYYIMFYDCSYLTTAPDLPATNLQNHCYDSMFTGCASLTTAPNLPATNLYDHCYYAMFAGCTSLTTAPALPATNLADNCYGQMFYSCTSLQVSDTQTSEAPYAWRIPTEDTFVAGSSQSSMFYRCAGTRASNDLPGETGSSYTYYTQNQPI